MDTPVAGKVHSRARVGFRDFIVQVVVNICTLARATALQQNLLGALFSSAVLRMDVCGPWLEWCVPLCSPTGTFIRVYDYGFLTVPV